MKVELKAVKFYPSLSEETNCFQATIYVDGKKAGTAENRGTGGPTDYHFADATVEAAFCAYAKSLPAIQSTIKNEDGSLFSYPMNGEHLIDELFEQHLKGKDAARIAKVAAQEKARFTAKGLQTLQIESKDTVMWVGVKDPLRVTEVVQKVAAKHKLVNATFRLI